MLFVFGFATLEVTGRLSAELDASMRVWFGSAVLSSLGLVLLALVLSALRTLHYARQLTRWRERPGTQHQPPTPAQRAVARGIIPGDTRRPFVGLWISALVLMLLGSFLAGFALIDFDRDGSPGMFWGGLIAALAGLGLNRLVALMRRSHVAARLSWRHHPTDPGLPDQEVVPVDLPRPHRGILLAERILRGLGMVAVVVFAVAAALGLGPASASRALLPWVIASDREIAAPLIMMIFGASLGMVLLLAVSLGLGAVRSGVLFRALELTAGDTRVEAGQIPATRPASELTMEALGGGGGIRRATQLLAGSGALVVTLAVPALQVLALRSEARLPGGFELVTLVGAAAIVLAFIAELLSAGRRRDRRNHLLQTWPRALAPQDAGRRVP